MSPRAGKKGITNASGLSGAEKAAVILLSLGEDAQAIWEGLDEEEVKDISSAMASLGAVPSSVVEDLLMEFVSGLSTTGAIMGSYEQTQRLLNAFLPPEKVDSLMEEIRVQPVGPCGTSWPMLMRPCSPTI